MKAMEVRQLTVEELKRKYEDLQRELFMARVARYTENVTDTTRVGRIKKDIARVRTVLREADLGLNTTLHTARNEEE